MLIILLIGNSAIPARMISEIENIGMIVINVYNISITDKYDRITLLSVWLFHFIF